MGCRLTQRGFLAQWCGNGDANMHRFARILAAAPLLVGVGLLAGCGGNAAGLTTSSTESKIPSNDDPMARPTFVAWTSARAKRCGFFFGARSEERRVGKEWRHRSG